MAANGFLSRLRKDTSGNVLAISAAAMIPLTVLVGSALDLGVTYMARGKLQNACDAAVLAARQSMSGATFDTDVEDEGDRFFTFNFPAGTAGVDNADFNIAQDATNPGQLNATASAKVPTSLVRMIGVNDIDISVDCEAMKELGYNDIMLVLDVTGSMNNAPSNGPGTKIERLREGSLGLYRAMQGDGNAFTRFGMMPYSHTVNVGRSLSNVDILQDQKYVQLPSGSKTVNIAASSFIPGGGADVAAFRTSGRACVEERATIDPANPVANGSLEIRNYVTVQDINQKTKGAWDAQTKFGRYDPPVQEGESQDGCPAEASRLEIYDTETDFQIAVDNATANVTGGTYHDVGMLWATRFLSRNGFFKGSDYEGGDNAAVVDGNPVNMHIVFMTDGRLDTGARLYSAHGVEQFQARTTGTGTQREKHIARFASACNRAKAMGMTIWVIALDVTDTSSVSPCASSPAHFYTSDGSDLEEVFEKIGRGIGKLRLVQ